MSLVSLSLIYFSLAAFLTEYPLELEEIKKRHTEEVNQARMSDRIIQLEGFTEPKIAQLFRSIRQSSIANQPFRTKSDQQGLDATKETHHPVSTIEPLEEASELHKSKRDQQVND